MTEQPLPSLPPSPPLSLLLKQPAAFYAALKELEPLPWRYAGLVALTGLVSGLAAAATARATVQAQSALNIPGMSAPATYGTLVFSGVFLMVVTWLMLWFLGNLGAGNKARAAEVYGATFLPQLLWSAALLVLGLLVQPHVNVSAPNLHGLDQQHTALALQKYNQAVAAQVAAHPAFKISGYLGYLVYLWQFALAYQGFVQTAAGPRKALLSVAYPAALFVVLGAVFWLLNQAMGQLVAP